MKAANAMRIEEMIGDRIREARSRRDVSQRKLGEMLAERLGKEWTRQAVSLAERGGRALTAAEVLAFADALDVPIVSLLAPPPALRTLYLPGGWSVDADRVLLGLPPQAGDLASYSLADALKQVAALSRVNAEEGDRILQLHEVLVALARLGVTTD